MKLIYSLVAVLAFTFAGFAQDALYIKYETDIDATGEEGEMMAMMMDGSTMELAVGSERTWVSTNMGTMMTMTVEIDNEADQMTMFMTGMMGKMAFQGKPDELDNEEEVDEDVEVELVDETKKILGIKCKKAIITDAEGNQAVYWYSEKFERPDGVSKMPNQVPGLCLQMEMAPQEGMAITYTAIEVNEDADMDKYKIVIPEDVEVQSFEEMQNMGMGGM